MKRYLPVMVLMVIFMIATGCSPKVELTNLEKEAADTLKIDEGILKKLKAKPLYQFTENDLDVYLAFCQYTIPDLRDRVQHLARKNIGQTYDIYLLGEFPVEIYDDQPLYNLKNSDCVVFVEHIYAMALSYDWQSFFATLQRIRYRDGIISYAARNHYGDYDWWRSNRWLVKDMTDDLIGAGAVKDTVYVNKTKLFKRRSIPYAVPKDSLVWTYIPLERAEEVMDRLEKGDLVNVVRGYKNSAWVGHFGLVETDED